MDEPIEAKPEGIEISPEFLAGNIREGLEKIRARLLDLTNRNRLLNYFHRAASSLRFVDVTLDELFQSLLDGQKVALEWVPEPEERGLVRSTEGGRLQKPDPHDYADSLGWNTSYDLKFSGKWSGRLHVLHYLEKLDTITRRMESAARTAIEESGTNMLYLAFGFLEWYESDDSDQPHHAPLLMIPVSLERARPKAVAFEATLEYSGEDLSPNLSLIEKLRKDFGLETPSWGDSDLPPAPDAYFSSFQDLLRLKRRWKICPQLTLTLLSFGKFLMYRDLDPKNWPSEGLSNHTLVRHLFEGIKCSGVDHAEEYSIDAPQEQHRVVPELIMDADSSQHSALIDALAEKNLVIEGPPGTGKSQTITNLIAAALAKGKTVLFVAEKLAALEVVRRRLDSVGLGTFCLELHSHKTKKQELIRDLEQRLKRRGSFGDPSNLDAKRRLLAEKKDLLNKYVSLINSQCSHSGERFSMSFGHGRRG